MQEESSHDGVEQSEWVEVVAATEQEAHRKAMECLGLAQPDRLEILLVETLEPTGWLERLTGRSQVRLRARCRPSVTEEILRHLRVLMAHLGVQAEPQVVAETEEEVHVNLAGDHEVLGLIIGTHGHTLNALQLLLNAMMNRGGGSRRWRVVLDADGYREKHRQRLERLAHRSAQKAKRWNREVVLESMTAGERRVIHTALQHDPEVISFSEGDEPHRRLIIVPRRHGSR